VPECDEGVNDEDKDTLHRVKEAKRLVATGCPAGGAVIAAEELLIRLPKALGLALHSFKANKPTQFHHDSPCIGRISTFYWM
jgi:hypothetical protein